MKPEDHVWLDLLRGEIEQFRDSIRDLRVTPEIDLTDLRNHLNSRYRFDEPVETDELFEDLARLLREQTVHATHPRYFGLFNPSVTLPSIVGDALAALYNPQLAAWSHAPAVNEMERHVLASLAAAIGLDPTTTQANFTTGGAEANFSAVLVALASRIDDFVENGAGSTRPVIYVSSESHHSFHKIAVMTGLGTRAIRTIPVDSSLRIDPVALERQIVEDRRAAAVPLFIVATAGTTSAGTIDPIERLADLSAREGLWLHVDAAWGASYLLVPSLRSAFAGIERADSITWDAHKGLSVPMGAGMFFCRHREAVMKAFSVRTAYMPANEGGTTDPYSSTVQWTRRAIGLKLFVSLASLGFDGYREYLEHQTRMGERLRERLVAAEWSIVNDTPLPVVCFTNPSLENDPARHASFAGAIQSRGRVWISPTVIGGQTSALRACITSYQTNEEDLDVLMEELESPQASSRGFA